MGNKSLTKQLKSLKCIQFPADFKKKQRDILISQVFNGKIIKQENNLGYFSFLDFSFFNKVKKYNFNFSLRPRYAFSLALVIFTFIFSFNNIDRYSNSRLHNELKLLAVLDKKEKAKKRIDFSNQKSQKIVEKINFYSDSRIRLGLAQNLKDEIKIVRKNMISLIEEGKLDDQNNEELSQDMMDNIDNDENNEIQEIRESEVILATEGSNIDSSEENGSSTEDTLYFIANSEKNDKSIRMSKDADSQNTKEDIIENKKNLEEEINEEVSSEKETDDISTSTVSDGEILDNISSSSVENDLNEFGSSSTEVINQVLDEAEELVEIEKYGEALDKIDQAKVMIY